MQAVDQRQKCRRQCTPTPWSSHPCTKAWRKGALPSSLASLPAVAAHNTGQNRQKCDHCLSLSATVLLLLTLASQPGPSVIPSYTSFVNYSSRSAFCIHANSSWELQPLRLESRCRKKTQHEQHCATPGWAANPHKSHVNCTSRPTLHEGVQ